MAKRKRRIRSPHPGVVLLERKWPSGRSTWRARYVDPETGARAFVTLDPTLTTHEARTSWAKSLAAQLGRTRAELAAGIRPEPQPEPTTLDAAIATYLEGAALAPKTLATYGLALAQLRAWAQHEGVTQTRELTAGRLASLRDWIIRAPKRTPVQGGKRGAQKAKGKPRSPVSINRELRTLGTVLGAWRRRELLSVSSDQIRDAMKRVPVPRELPTYLAPAEIKRLLEAALRHDAACFTETREEHAGLRAVGSTPRYPAIAPFVAFLLLTGCRRGEALALRWADVDLDALDASGNAVGELRLRAADVKTRTARVVGLEVSPALRRILAALRLRRGKAERVFSELTEDAITSALRRLLGEYGAPDFTWQILRSTCATYLVNAPGIFGAASAFLAARQLGHSVVVAEKRYAGQLRGLPRDARTLEAAMQCETEVSAVLARTSEARGKAPAKRKRARRTAEVQA